jgi:hypothetical protein
MPCSDLQSDAVKQRHEEKAILCPAVVNLSMPNIMLSDSSL